MTNPPPHRDSPFATWVRRTVAERGWSYQDLAETIDVSPTTVSWWANGCSTPQWDALERLAAALGKDVGELVHEIAAEPTGPAE